MITSNSQLSLQSDGKSLRTAPRKISNVEEKELLEFEQWLKLEEAKKEPKADFTHHVKKSIPEKIISIQDQAVFNKKDPIYRKISFTPIPTQFKPHYEKEETFLACSSIDDMMQMREKYIYYDAHILQHPFLKLARPIDSLKIIPSLCEVKSYSFIDGIIFFEGLDMITINKSEFYSDLQFITEKMFSPSNKSFCYLRLKLLLMKFNMHLQCNNDRESFDQKIQSRKDFYNIIKIDNHIHLDGCMNQKHLQKFIKNKLIEEPNTIVCSEKNSEITLEGLMSAFGLDAATLTVDVVDRYGVKSEKYAHKYSPLNNLSLKDIFLSHENFINGRYFGELVHEVIQGYDAEKYVLAEIRITICGKSSNEWEKTAKWIKTNNLQSPNIRWIIQVPRVYSELKSKFLVNSFDEILKNIFEPVLKASLDPEMHPEITEFLSKTVAFDLVNDEEKSEKIKSFSNYKEVLPSEWNCEEEPTYSYWSYYLYSNISALNHLRRARGLNTFAFRPHCGEAGSTDHLAVGFLLSHSISHGIKLAKIPVLQYLFYLTQIGLSMSPLSNSKLFVKFLKNPILKFFIKGLNVTLSTDDPLSIHLTKDPLMEEYSVLAQTLDLNGVDLCEIARNSVLQSGFPLEKKQKWLGEAFMEGENDSAKSNLSSIRYTYRRETFIEEHSYLARHAYNADDM